MTARKPTILGLAIGIIIGQIAFMEYSFYRESKNKKEFNEWLASHPFQKCQTCATFYVSSFRKE